MNLEKTINKNIFNMSSALHNANPLLPPNPIITDPHEQQQDSPSSTPIPSLLTNPKQKLTTQFKRAITIIKQKSDPSTPPVITTNEKPTDPTILTSLIEEPIKQKDNIEKPGQMSTSSTLTPKSQSFVQIKSPSNQILSRINTDSNTPSPPTILTIDPPPTIRINHPNSPSARMVKQSLQQIHSSILQTMHQHSPLSPTTSSSATLSPTSTSTSTSGTGEVAILETIL
jgi:hypothetical protein